MESRIDPQNDDKNGSVEERLNKLANDIKNLPADRVEELEKVINLMGKRVVTVKEAAKMMGVHVDTIRRAIKSKKLKAFQLNNHGGWRVSLADLESFINGEK